MLRQYPGRCCLYIEKKESCKLLNNLQKKKYLVPKGVQFDQLIYIIRSRLVMKKETALFCYVNKRLINGSVTIGELYDKHKAEDKFLYIQYAGENCFG